MNNNTNNLIQKARNILENKNNLNEKTKAPKNSNELANILGSNWTNFKDSPGSISAVTVGILKGFDFVVTYEEDKDSYTVDVLVGFDDLAATEENLDLSGVIEFMRNWQRNDVPKDRHRKTNLAQIDELIDEIDI